MSWRSYIWLVLGVINTVLSYARPQGSLVLNDRTAYHSHARNAGMCSQRNDPYRVLVVPGPDVVSKFSVCQGRNEFGELVSDTSGAVYCNGTLIHLWNDARDHRGDSKTFVDRASNFSGAQINSVVRNLLQQRKFTVSEFIKEVETTFQFQNDPGRELQEYDNIRFPNTPLVVPQIRPQARTFRAWTKIVHHYWNNLDRTMIQNCISEHKDDNDVQLLPGLGSPPAATNLMAYGYPQSSEERCATSIIRLEHPFVIAGGRFREQYYWDSFFVMEGMLAANMTYLARTTLLNFMDEIRSYGFIPNGGRWDYTARWMGDPRTLPGDRIEQMRRVRVRRIIPVDLNSILYRCHMLIAELYQRAVDDESPYAWQHKRTHEKAASALKAAILDLHWSESRAAFYDFELDAMGVPEHPQTGRTGGFWSGAALAPYWSGIWPESVQVNQSKAMEAFAGMRDLLRRWVKQLANGRVLNNEGGGGIDTKGLCRLPSPSLANSGISRCVANLWDSITAFTHGLGALAKTTLLVLTESRSDIAIKALQNIPFGLTTQDAFEFAKTSTPKAQLGVEYANLPVMDGEDIQGRELDGTTSSSWRNVMLKELAMRYMTAAFCNWNVTGKLRDDDIEEIVRDDASKDMWLSGFPGAMYEKLNAWDVTRSGHGGEYEIQTGSDNYAFSLAGQTAHELGMKLDNPTCPVSDPASAKRVLRTHNEMYTQL
ncbi:hypothetical protein FRC10_007112 [Ceratobasidium sp. 414]|nr:hypothetical protein FRC10_007112 [Ceratobasidium sp. 414]